MSVGPRAEKFNIISNNQGIVSNDQRPHAIFLFLTRKFPFWANLVKKKIKIVSLRWNLVPRLIRICRTQWWFSLFYAELNGDFLTGITLFGKLGPKNQNCQFKLKFGTFTNSNMQNSIVLSTFSVLDGKHPFWATLVQKIKVASFSWNLVPRLNETCRIQWWCSPFSVLY